MASKRRIRRRVQLLAERACKDAETGRQKQQFATAEKARRAALALHFNRGERRLNVYHCHVCGWWHYGHMPSTIPVPKRLRVA